MLIQFFIKQKEQKSLLHTEEYNFKPHKPQDKATTLFSKVEISCKIHFYHVILIQLLLQAKKDMHRR